MSRSPWHDDGGRNRPPCKGCPDKKAGCQDRCQKPEWLAYQDMQRRIKEARAKYQGVDGYQADQIRQNRRPK